MTPRLLTDQPECERLRRLAYAMLERAMSFQAAGKTEDALRCEAVALYYFTESRIARAGAEALAP
jgi:hypothetical protein